MNSIARRRSSSSAIPTETLDVGTTDIVPSVQNLEQTEPANQAEGWTANQAIAHLVTRQSEGVTVSINSIRRALPSSAVAYMSTPVLSMDTPFVSIRVHPADLRGAVDNGLRKHFAPMYSRFSRKTATVEASRDGVKDFIFYSPEGDPNFRRATPTEFIKSRSDVDNGTLVRRTDDFEITFVGMSVIPQDTIFGGNELLLYSVKTSPHGKVDVPDDAEKIRNSDSVSDLESQLTDVEQPKAPTAEYSLGPDDVPFIHYDPVVDGHDVGTEPNSFVPIPASKALYIRHEGSKAEPPENGLSSINMRFLVLEIDKVSDGTARAVGSVSSLGKMVKASSAAVPYLQPLSMAISAASALGKEGLKNYAKPDHVLTKDVSFLLAEPEEEGENTGHESASCAGSSTQTRTGRKKRVETYGNFLRYGYYFFLGKKVDAKLYAQTGSSSQTVPLLLRRHPYTPEMGLRDEKEFFPLTGISYVVIKVSPGCSRKYGKSLKMMLQDHRNRLDNMLQMSAAMEMLSKV